MSDDRGGAAALASDIQVVEEGRSVSRLLETEVVSRLKVVGLIIKVILLKDAPRMARASFGLRWLLDLFLWADDLGVRRDVLLGPVNPAAIQDVAKHIQ